MYKEKDKKVLNYIHNVWALYRVQAKKKVANRIKERQQLIGVYPFYAENFPEHIEVFYLKNEHTGLKEQICMQRTSRGDKYYFHSSFCFKVTEGEIEEIININNHYRNVREIGDYYRKYITVENRYMKLFAFTYGTERLSAVGEGEIDYMKKRMVEEYKRSIKGLHLQRREKQRERIHKAIYNSLQLNTNSVK